jgi:hypothetical protein
LENTSLGRVFFVLKGTFKSPEKDWEISISVYVQKLNISFMVIMGIRALYLTTVSIVIAFGLAACGQTEKPKPKPGRCSFNGDCPEGFHCRDTFCEDIYYPRDEIKPY